MSSLYVDTIRNKDGNGAPVFDRGIVISGIITASGSLAGDSVGIGSTTVVDASFQLQNILSLDSTTLATFESALEIEPNNFNSLRISGVSTFLSDVFAETDVYVTGLVSSSRISGVALSASDSFYSIGVSTVTYLQGTHLNYSGISTISYPEGINLYYSGISTLVNARGTSLYFSGISTADHLRSTTLYSAGVSTVTYLQGTHLNYSGISTITNLYAPESTIDLLSSGISTITNLNSSSITGSALTATSANITTLVAGTSNVTTSNLQTVNAVSIAATTLDGDSIVGLAATITNLNSSSFDTQSATVAIATVTTIDVDTVDAINVDTLNVSSTGIVTSTEFHTGPSATSIRVFSDRITGPSEIVIDPATTGTAGTVRIAGDLYVDGDQFFVNSGTIELADLAVGIATTVTSNSLLNGGGILIGDISIQKSFVWNNSSTSLKSSENLDIASGKTYKINGTDVLSSTTLGTGVTISSLTSVGTLQSLVVGTNISATGNILGAGIYAGFSTITTLSGDSLNYPSAFINTGIITNTSGERLNYTGLSTITHARGTTLNYTGISTVTHARGTTLNYTGISTLPNLVGTNLSYSGISTITNIYAGFTTSIILNTDSFRVAGVSTFSNTINTQNISVTGDVDITGSFKISSTDVLTSTTLGTGVTSSSLNQVGTLNNLSVLGTSNLSGTVNFGGIVYESLGGEVQSGGNFPTGVTYNGITDVLTIDFNQIVDSNIAGDPIGEIDVIALTNLPVTGSYLTRLTLITEGDAGGWDTGAVSITINGSAPSNAYWRNNSQPVGTTTSNPAFDIIRMMIMRDDSGNFSVFADWDPYYD